MTQQLKNRLLLYLSRRKASSESGFTLVELIVVVVIIGILSSIAIPSFQSAGDKAKQKEASTLISSYIKASAAYFTEYSESPRNSRDLAQYVSVVGCPVQSGKQCKTRTPTDYSRRASTRWNSPSGLYQITYQRQGTQFVYIRAIPAGAFRQSGYGVAGCFNTQTGSTKVIEEENKGTNVRNRRC